MLNLNVVVLLIAIDAPWNWAKIRTDAATHDEIPQCGLTGVYKSRQSIIISPNYPNYYPKNTCYDYVIRSPFRCPTKFHIQFLDFFLETSPQCKKDYLAIGLDNDSEDMDILCGQVVGIKKYATPDGVLRLRFFSDDSLSTTEKGFKLLVTRLACEQEEELRDQFTTDKVKTVVFESPAGFVTSSSSSPTPFTNIQIKTQTENNNQDHNKQLTVSPVFVVKFQDQLPAPPSSHIGEVSKPLSQPSDVEKTSEKPCEKLPVADESSKDPNPHVEFLFNEVVQPVRGGPMEICCASSFSRKHFYLSSPGFPRTAFTSLLPIQQRDCLFLLRKYTPNVCRLYVEFKFFDFGQPNVGAGTDNVSDGGVSSSSEDMCMENYLEVDGARFCGCRTGQVYTISWGPGQKAIRMRIGYSDLPSKGFLLDLKQDECQETPPLDIFGTFLTSLQTNRYPPPSLLEPRPFELPLLIPPAIFTQQLLPIRPAQPFRPMPAFFQQNFGRTEFPVTRFPRQTTIRHTSSNQHQPVTVVETNSTRTEYYFFDGDEEFRSTISDDYSKESARRSISGVFEMGQNRCPFNMEDMFRLSVDPLWLDKPICYTYRRNWLSNLWT